MDVGYPPNPISAEYLSRFRHASLTPLPKGSLKLDILYFYHNRQEITPIEVKDSRPAGF
jgi:hypothetical protein